MTTKTEIIIAQAAKVIEQYLDFGILKERNQALAKGKAEIKEMIKTSLNRDRLPTKKYPKRKQ